ncbi:esterase-like activity of phytase family protein [Bosea vestrisii]|uniref:Esterase-like activity of phytase family protein n=1 Tax=Bosea vestrisii TaxID=151416 RepID=A0ABW0HCX1_9HYPH
MSLSRRSVLTGLSVAVLAAPVRAQSLEPGRVPVSISARPIASFEPGNPTKTRFGQLIFRGGLQLSGSHPRFGGFSGLWRSPDGARLVAITDNGFWLTARVARSSQGKLAGLEEAELAPILGASGKPLHRSRYFDTESLAIAGGTAFIGVERTHDILRFDWARHGVEARAQLVPVPPAAKRLPSNRGFEAIGVLPAGHPLAGALIAISERSGREDEPTTGFIIGGRQPGTLQVLRREGYDITDLAFLPGGDMLLLERWYKPLRGVGMRIRRIAGGTIRPGAKLDGEILIEADLGQEIDNMEGMAVHQESGRTIVTLISDDNFSTFLQRTVLLEFELTQ